MSMPWLLKQRGNINYITDFYGNTEYIGKDAYGYHNPSYVSSIYELEDTSRNNKLAELEDTSCGKVKDNKTSNSICELNAMSIDGTMTTETFDKDFFDYRHKVMIENMKGNIKNYEIKNNNRSFLSKIAVAYEVVNDNITFIYIKATEISKRKIYWTIWAKGRGKYESYKEFKRTWDSNTHIWHRLEKSVKHDIRKDIESLLGFDNTKKYIKKSVRKEVEKALAKNNPFNVRN